MHHLMSVYCLIVGCEWILVDRLQLIYTKKVGLKHLYIVIFSENIKRIFDISHNAP